MLLVDIKTLNYLAIEWWKVKSTEDLVVAREEKLLRQKEMVARVAKRL